MARTEDLPTELMTYVTDYLQQFGDLAAFARTSRKLYHIVDSILYKRARNLNAQVPWHPLRWSAENGETGTLRKALAAGIDANLLFDVTIDRMMREMQSFQIRVEAVDGDSIWDPPEWNPSDEWRPTDNDTDYDFYDAKPRLVNPPPWDAYEVGLGDHDISDDEDTDGFGLSFDDDDDLPESPTPALPDSESSDEDHEGRSSVVRSAVRGFRALHLAARGGHDHVVQILLANGADVDLCSRQLCTCEAGFARSHSTLHGEIMNRRRVAGFSPLHLAICHFHPSTAKLLLSHGASVRLSEPRRDGAGTALHAAAATGQTDLCKHLLDHGYVSDVDVLDNNRLSPFYYAYYNGHWDTTVAILLERGANIDFLIRHSNNIHPMFDDHVSTILHEACVFGRYEDAIKLVHLGADVSKGRYSLDTQVSWPLHAACRPPRECDEPPRNPPLKHSREADSDSHKRAELIEMMLRRGADIESMAQGESPLHRAAKFDMGSALRTLLAAGAKVNSRGHRGRTPLMVACVPERQQNHNSLLHALWSRSEDNLVKMLLDHGSNINSKDDDGNTALHLVCTPSSHMFDERYDDDQKQERTVRLLLERGADVSARNKLGVTPFETAFMKGCLESCDILVRRGKASQTLQHKDLQRMLLFNIGNRPANFDALHLLLDLDVGGCLYDKSNYIMAMVENNASMACAYLERGLSPPPLSPKERLIILHAAIEQDVLALARRMVAMKVSVNSLNKDGHTPLYALVFRKGSTYGRDRLVEALLEAGADIHLKPNASPIMTPLEKAIVNGEQILVNLMLRYQPLRSDSQAISLPAAPTGVYLHAAARTVPSKRMFSTLIRSGASVTEVDSSGDYPLAVFLKFLVNQPAWMEHARGAAEEVCATIWYLWSRDLDINRRNKTGKSVLSYLTALRLYSGKDSARANIARVLQQRIVVVPVRGPNKKQGDKALEFRHGTTGLGALCNHAGEEVTGPSPY